MSDNKHVVDLGGKERELRYTLASRRFIETTFKALYGRPVPILDALDDGTIEGQAVLLAAGLQHASKNLAVNDVIEWMDAENGKGRDLFEALVLPCKRALGESGVAGFRFTYDQAGAFKRIGAEGKE